MADGARSAFPANGVSFETMVESLYDGVYLVDPDRTILYWNQGAQRLTGYSREEVLGKHCRDNLLCHVNDDGESLCLGRCPLAATLEDGANREVLVHLHHRDGHRAPVNVRTAPVRDNAGNIIAAIEIFSSAADQHALLARLDELARMAYLDELSQLPNRRYAEARIQSSLHELDRYEWPFGFLMLDIDHFKRVNDVHGHAVGDEVIRMVARTLQAAARTEDLVARWGGEEFIAVLKGGDLESLEVTANRFRTLVGQSYLTAPSGGEVAVTISVGGCMATPRDNIAGLAARADALLYRSKENGRDRVTIA